MGVTILSSKSLLESLNHFKQLVVEYDQLLNENIDMKHKMLEMEEINKSFMSVSLIVNTKNENEKLNNENHLLRKKIIYLEKEIQSKNQKIKDMSVSSYTKKDEVVSTIDTPIPKVEDTDMFKIDKNTHTYQVDNDNDEVDDNDDEVVDDNNDNDDNDEVVDDNNDDEVVDDNNDDEVVDEDDTDSDEIELYEYEYCGKMYFVSDDDHKHVYDRIKTEDGDYEPSDDYIGQIKMINGKEEVIWE